MGIRFEKLNELLNHAHYGNLMKKLNRDESVLILKFIQENEALNRNDFVFKVNRYFISKERPKNWTLICEILTVIA